jgi:hypothetical protein
MLNYVLELQFQIFYFRIGVWGYWRGADFVVMYCKIVPISALDMAGYNPLNMNMSLGHLAAMNPFFLSQNGALLNQLLGQSGMNAAMHQGWAGGLSGKTVSQLWMNDETKVGRSLSEYLTANMCSVCTDNL